MILHGRSRQTQAVFRAQRPRYLRYFGARILDRLRFVEDEKTEFPSQQDLAVELQQRVAGEDDVSRFYAFEQFLALGSVQGQQRKLGRKTADFLLPISEDADGRH